MATSIKIDDQLKERVKRLAARRDRSPHWLMREAIKQYVEREEAQESFRQEALESWAAFRDTGLHLTGAETADWLARWASDVPPPACHD